jgi:hypothetical protein
MGNISITTPSDGQTIDAADIAIPLNTIVNEINGNLSNANIASNAAIARSKIVGFSDGWENFTPIPTVSTGYNSGNRSFTLDMSTDVSTVLSPGMRYKVNRNTTPPTQCADLEASSSQYASKSSPTGITFTTAFTCEAWVKLESYIANSAIISRFSGSGWIFRTTASGQLEIVADNSSGSIDTANTYQSIPLGKWVHVAARMDVSSGAAAFLMDGVEVPDVYTSGTTTSITQSGDLEVGSYGGSNFLDGKISDARLWSTLRTNTEIQDNMFGYPSDTTGLVAHFKLAGDFTDSSSNANTLTASGGAVATNVDNPWNATEYGIITAVSATTIQVFCPTGYGIPNETLTAPFYSTQSTPFGFPRGRDKWTIQVLSLSEQTQASATGGTWYNVGSYRVEVPIGSWRIGYGISMRGSDGTAYPLINTSLSTSASSESLVEMTGRTGVSINNTSQWNYTERFTFVDLTASQTYYVIHKSSSSTTTLYLTPSTTGSIIYAECAYL